jgi:hypothetical protein
MEYTVIGDNINRAQRIESLACRWQVFAAESTWRPAAGLCSAIQLPAAQVKGKSVETMIYSIRGVSDDAGTMLLNIPVSIVNSGGAPVKAMLVEFIGADSTARLEVQPGAALPDDGPIVLEFDLPELTRQIRLTGRCKPAADISQKNGAAAAAIILDNLSGEDALAFFIPGSCIASGKTWDAMTRH